MVRLYTTPVGRIKPILITVISAQGCIFCEAAKKEISWLERELNPYVRYMSRSVGEINPKLEARSPEALARTSLDMEITEYYHQFESNTPLTVIGPLDDPIATINGCDKFSTQLADYPIESTRALTKEHIELIRKNALDGVLYSNHVYHRYIQEETGIIDKKVIDNLELRLKKRAEILYTLQKATEQLQQNQIKIKPTTI